LKPLKFGFVAEFEKSNMVCIREDKKNKKAPHFCEAFVVPSGETANKFNEHLELILDFMGVLEHEPELWDKIKEAENASVKA
jgi:hypothetical protein